MTTIRFVQSSNNLLCALTQGLCSRNQIFIEAVLFSVEDYNDDLYEAFDIKAPFGIERWATKRKAEFLAGRLAAKHALQKLELVETEVRVGEHRAPIWPHGSIGSITHTNSIAVAAVSLEKNITLGIDLECQLSEVIDTSTFISRKEQAVIDAVNFFNPSLLSTAVFSAKESFFKAAYPYVKRYFDFDAIELEKFTDSVMIFRIQPSLVELYSNEPDRNLIDIYYEKVNVEPEKKAIFTMAIIPESITASL